MRLPAVMLCRAGSKRLPGKNRLDWCGKPLWRHALDTAFVPGTVKCLSVVTDDSQIQGADFARFEHPMPDTHTSIEGVNWWREQAMRDAEYCLLIQCTNPFLSRQDIERLVAIAFHDGPPTSVWAIGSRGKPNGTAWIIPPCATDTIAKRFVEPDVWGVDIDTQDDYGEACKLWQSLHG